MAYTEITNGVVTVVGIGADRLSTEDPGLQKPAGKLLLKVIKQAGNELDFGDDGQYLSSDPWFPTLQYELRNFYDLGARNIATATMNLKVRRLEGGQAVNPDNIDQVPLIRILGLDQKDLLRPVRGGRQGGPGPGRRGAGGSSSFRTSTRSTRRGAGPIRARGPTTP